MSDDYILTEVRDGVGTITLNRPEVLNALSPEMTDRLARITLQFQHDPAVRCVVFRGNGPSFLSGTDVAQMHHWLTEEREQHLAEIETKVLRSHEIIQNLRRMPKPVIAAVHGAVAGLGCGILLAADLAIARDDTFMMVAYRHVGLSADCGVSHFLPRLLGERRALQLGLLGERIDATTGLEFGLFNWVVDVDFFNDKIDKVVVSIMRGPALALAEIKRLYRASHDNSWNEQSHQEAESIAALAATADHLEGVAAFVEKRRPGFVGR